MTADAAAAADGPDPGRLAAWLDVTVPGFAGPVEISKFAGGQSNPTYLVSTPGRDFVLRRKPPGKLLPGAHAVEREYRVITALQQAGFPVPRSYGLCEDPSVAGTPFYVMDRVEGRIFWDPTLPDVPRAERRAYYESMCEVIATLHGLDYDQLGLGDYGKHGGFVARQVALWTRQYREDEDAGRIDAMDRLCEWLPEHLPDDGETTIVHGDYRCDNLVFHPTEARVVAVLDWELSTLGDPLADFTYHLMTYRTPASLHSGLSGRDPAALGLPTEAEYIAAYCRHTGRDGIADLDFYFAYNLWRLAAIIHGVKGRMLRGNASSKQAGALVKHLDVLAETAWQQALKAS